MNNEFKRMQELAGIVKEEMDHTQFPQTFNHRDEEFILGAVTPDMLFYINPEEGDDNANVIAMSHDMKILSDNIHAANEFLGVVQERAYTWLIPELEEWAFETQEEFNIQMK
jgi:hypothetical protein